MTKQKGMLDYGKSSPHLMIHRVTALLNFSDFAEMDKHCIQKLSALLKKLVENGEVVDHEKRSPLLPGV